MPFESFGCMLPTSAELDRVQAVLLPQYLDQFQGVKIFPFQTTDKATIVIQEPDIFRGKQKFRGLNKPTQHVTPRHNAWGTFTEIQPGYWGEHDTIDEEMMTRWGDRCASVFDATEYISMMQARLLQRQSVLIEYNIWQTLVFGRYVALDNSGNVIHENTFNVQNVTAGVPWTNFGGSFPLRDFRAIQLLGRGQSARFDTCARAYMNRQTANLLFANTNPFDIGRIGLSACCTFMSPELINQQFAAQGLPQIVIYDDGWIDDNGTFNVFIPFGYVVIVGCRPNGDPIGKYWLTRNAVGCSVSSGFWNKVIDNCDREISRKITLAMGHNGTPVLRYPRAVVVLRVV